MHLQKIHILGSKLSLFTLLCAYQGDQTGERHEKNNNKKHRSFSLCKVQKTVGLIKFESLSLVFFFKTSSSSCYYTLSCSFSFLFSPNISDRWWVLRVQSSRSRWKKLFFYFELILTLKCCLRCFRNCANFTILYSLHCRGIWTVDGFFTIPKFVL